MRARFKQLLKTYLRRWLTSGDDLSAGEQRRITQHITSFAQPPTFSVVMPTYESNIEWLHEAIKSVQNQIYPHWELCIADDASPSPKIRTVLEKYAAEDARIKVVIRETNGHISACSNSALELATGDYVALLDHDDTLPPQALYRLAATIDEQPDLELIYTDEDKISGGEECYPGEPYFKSEWDLDLFFGHNMFNHLGCFKRSTMVRIGGFREGFEGSQDYDLVLRMIAKVGEEKIFHIPEILYHWRSCPGSAAAEMDAKPYATEKAREAIQAYLKKFHKGAEVHPHAEPAFHQVSWPLPKKLPLVSILIHGNRAGSDAEQIRQIKAKINDYTRYSNIEVIVAHQHEDLNRQAKRASGEFILFLDQSVEPETYPHPDRCWLGELVSMAIRSDVGAISPKLIQPDGKLQTSGFFWASNKRRPLARVHPGIHGHDDFGYFGRARQTHQASVLPQETLLIKHSIWKELGGLNLTEWPYYAHIDLCLRVIDLGYKCLVHGSVSATSPKELLYGESCVLGESLRLKSRWKHFKERFYNPNLDRLRYNYTPALRLLNKRY